MNLRLAPAARFVSKWEGFSSPAVLDTLARPPVWTVGYGHTRYAGSPTPFAGMTISKRQARRVLANDLRASARAVDARIKHKITPRQRIALISFTYNLGKGALDQIAPMVNRGEISAAADAMLAYDHAGGVRVEGLSRRRRAERWLMLHSRAVRNPHRPN